MSFTGPHLLPLPDQAIALFALGIAFARLEADAGVTPLWTLLIALVSGMALGARLSPGQIGLARALPLLLIGVLLIDPGDKSRLWPGTVTAVAAMAAGLSYGATLPDDFSYFVHGAFFASTGIITAMVASFLWKRWYRPWHRVALKIAGSWMVAIGTILTGAALR